VARRSPALLALAGLALTLTACGARVDSSLRTEAANAELGRNGGGSSVTSGGGSGTSATGTGTSSGSTSGTSGASGTSGTSGTSGATSGTGSSSTSGAKTSGTSGAPAPAGGNGGATDVGVTGNSITVGLVADSSGPVPGLFRGAFVGAQAYFAKINSEGGIFGRQLKIDFGDSQLDCGQNKSATQARVSKVFAFVGNFSLNDDCGEQVLAQHPEVPNVSNALGPKTAALPQTYSTAPLGNGWRLGPLQYYAKTYGAKWQHIGAIYAGVGTGPTVWNNSVKAINKSGGKVVHAESYGATDTDFTGAIIRMKSDGVQLTYINTTDGATTARFVNAARAQNVDWPLIFGGTAYDSNFLKQAGNNANGVINDQQFAMFFNADEAAKNPGVKDFQKWMNYVNSDQTKDIFSAYGWTSAMLFVDALKKAGAKATRKSLFGALKTFTNYDSGGMFAASNPAQKKPAVCWILDKVVNGAFVRQPPTPATGFNCSGATYYPPVG
jgi:ABC-type branched-subunit amino acid transport system substrate-binding protein